MDGIPITGFSALPVEDQHAIGKTLTAILTGFQQHDAETLATAFAVDADWINAFGTQKHGSSDIVSYLKGLFADANFDRGKVAGSPGIALRRITADVVAVTTHLQVEGQGLVDGGSIPVRNNFGLHILQKQPDGTWLVVSEMFMDARTDQTYETSKPGAD